MNATFVWIEEVLRLTASPDRSLLRVLCLLRLHGPAPVRGTHQAPVNSRLSRSLFVSSHPFSSDGVGGYKILTNLWCTVQTPEEQIEIDFG